MFSQNRNQPILTEFRGYFPHAGIVEFCKASIINRATLILFLKSKIDAP